MTELTVDAYEKGNKQLIDAIQSSLGSRQYSSNPISPSAYQPMNTSSSGMDLFSGSKNMISSLVDSAQNGITSVSNAVPRILEPWQKASQIGIGFNNDAIGLRTGIAQTRMSVAEWGDAIGKTQLGLTALGGTMSDGARQFTAFSRDFQTNGPVDELQAMGYTVAETNTVLALSLVGKKRADIEDKAGREEAMRSAAGLAVEMDKVAKLTGVSRKEQQDALDASMHNARTRIAVERAVAQGGEESRAAYKSLNAQMSGLGLKDFADNIYAGNAKTKETIEIQNALGPAGTQLESAINATKTATTEAERAAAERQLQDAQAAVAARMSEESFLNLAQKGLGPVSDAAGKVYISTMNYKDSLQAIQAEEEKKGNIIDFNQAAQLANDKAYMEQRAKNAKGEDVEGAKTTQLMTQSLRAMADQQAGIAKGLDIFNTTVSKWQATQSAIDFTKNIKKDEKTGQITGMMDRSFATEIAKEIQNASNSKNPTEYLTTKAMTVAGDITAKSIVLGKEGLNEIASQLNIQKPFDLEKEIGHEATGSKDVWGDWFAGPKNRLSFLGETEPEATVPLSKMQEFLGDISSELIKSVDSSQQPSIPQFTMPEKTERQPTRESNIQTATLDDLNTQLQKLNSTMEHLLHNSQEAVNLSSKQVRATKQLSPNVNLR